MKKLLKKIVAKRLGYYVRKLLQGNTITVIGIAGSVGKTSTKLAIARFLSTEKRVQYQDGNYNDLVSVPLIFFGLSMPRVISVTAWRKVFKEMRRQLKKPYTYDVVVVELGTDGPGQIAAFGQYLELNIGLVTAVAPEHMEFFSGLDSVAHEELSLQNFTNDLLINTDMVEVEYVNSLTRSYQTYSTTNQGSYMLTKANWDKHKQAYHAIFQTPSNSYAGTVGVVGKHQLQSILAAVAVAEKIGITKEAIERAINDTQPVAGRMNVLQGIHNTTIIDDTYNASPEAAKAALDAVYNFDAKHKIVVLGNMNELGEMSEDLHREVGEYCRSDQLEEVITIGVDANKYLAQAAAEQGCKTRTYTSPYELGAYLKHKLQPDTIVLLKGSQNGVFAEEAIKFILENKTDAEKLVRQTSIWLRIKEKQFGVIDA